MIATTSESVLTQALLDRCRERAPKYDRDNTFLSGRFRRVEGRRGYLTMALPTKYGGQGLTLQVSLGINSDEQPRWG